MSDEDLVAIAKAIGHPLRIRIIRELRRGPLPLSPTGMAGMLDEPLGNVSYHFKTLLETEVISLAGTKARRGASEHFYLLDGRNAAGLRAAIDAATGRFGKSGTEQPAEKVNLAERLSAVEGQWRPHRVGALNEYKVLVVKAKDDFVWHSHEDTDDFFLVLDGHLTIGLRDRDVELDAGEMFIVPRGVEHRPRADEEASVLVIEPEQTVNTGDAGGPLTTEPT